ncbi:iron response transcriptional regulator IrrA [Devosia sp. WQ 349K1]|uniref:iron response transcriptional regulator IrrA n=1 Tax=Devosia sp. WQ 349K1 TaxID=2800329 RepID=UPI0020B27431|nr:Fur family transcriptional regulator [Devosia sp. WQ 349K1]
MSMNIKTDMCVDDEPSRRGCIKTLLRMSGLRPTRQRVELADRIFGRGRHLTAEDLHSEVHASGQEMSLATVYNTLHQFQSSGLIRELSFKGTRAVFDTDTSGHHHFYILDDDKIIDMEPGAVSVTDVKSVPEGYEVAKIEIVVSLRKVEI